LRRQDFTRAARAHRCTGCTGVPVYRPPIEITLVLRVALRFPLRVDRRLVDPRPFGTAVKTKTVLPRRVHYEVHTRWNSSRAVPGLWQRIHSPVKEKGLPGVGTPPCPIHQSLPVRRMLRAPLSLSLSEGCASRFNPACKTRVLRQRWPWADNLPNMSLLKEFGVCRRLRRRGRRQA
jgi:hypothetical protein